ncbi:hypothetical protein [Streptomyces sp. NBC_00691]|uniref:hypothetical protein n=1 Tax=Streptomyces sp. NBC_00691 TaxID=2903671 RepID=UPI002E365FFD|nr:hypothetical protein [Streptomyces sp. NBC_00691]
MHNKIALVRPSDAQPASTAAREFYAEDLSYARLLFGPDTQGPTAVLTPRHRGMIGTLLTWSPPHEDNQISKPDLLAVIRATGCSQRLQLPDRHSPVPEAHNWTVGAVMLGAEIAARHLYQRLTHAHGPDELQPVARALAALWPLPGDTPADDSTPNPGLTLRRHLRPALAHLDPAETNALDALGRALSPPYSLDRRLRCAGRIAWHVGHHQGPRIQGLGVVRAAICTARLTGPCR